MGLVESFGEQIKSGVGNDGEGNGGEGIVGDLQSSQRIVPVLWSRGCCQGDELKCLGIASIFTQ